MINLGRPTGPRLRDLSYEQRQCLNAWLTLSLVDMPSSREEMPLEYTRALASLAKRRGIAFSFSSHEAQVAGEAILGRNIPGCVGGSKRKITANHEPLELSKVGQKVEPYHEREWRDDYL